MLEDFDDETRAPLAEAEFVLVVELDGKMVNITYCVPLYNVEEVNLKVLRTRADEIIKSKSRDELIKNFGAVKDWTCWKNSFRQ